MARRGRKPKQGVVRGATAAPVPLLRPARHSKDGVQPVHFSVKNYRQGKDGAARAAAQQNYIERPEAVEQIDTSILARADLVPSAILFIATSADGKPLASFGTLAPNRRARRAFWRKVARLERSKSNIQMSIIAELPHELSAEARLRVVHKFCAAQFTARGYPYWVAVHWPGLRNDPRNWHVHILVYGRPGQLLTDGWDFQIQIAEQDRSLLAGVYPWGTGERPAEMMKRLRRQIHRARDPSAIQGWSAEYKRASDVEERIRALRSSGLRNGTVIKSRRRYPWGTESPGPLRKRLEDQLHTSARGPHYHERWARQLAEVKRWEAENPADQAVPPPPADLRAHDGGFIVVLRSSWSDACNDELERLGAARRYSPLSYADLGIDVVPSQHLGAKAAASELAGHPTAAAFENDQRARDDLRQLGMTAEQIDVEALREALTRQRRHAGNEVAVASAAGREDRILHWQEAVARLTANLEALDQVDVARVSDRSAQPISGTDQSRSPRPDPSPTHTVVPVSRPAPAVKHFNAATEPAPPPLAAPASSPDPSKVPQPRPAATSLPPTYPKTSLRVLLSTDLRPTGSICWRRTVSGRKKSVPTDAALSLARSADPIEAASPAINMPIPSAVASDVGRPDKASTAGAPGTTSSVRGPSPAKGMLAAVDAHTLAPEKQIGSPIEGDSRLDAEQARNDASLAAPEDAIRVSWATPLKPNLSNEEAEMLRWRLSRDTMEQLYLRYRDTSAAMEANLEEKVRDRYRAGLHLLEDVLEIKDGSTPGLARALRLDRALRPVRQVAQRVLRTVSQLEGMVYGFRRSVTDVARAKGISEDVVARFDTASDRLNRECQGNAEARQQRPQLEAVIGTLEATVKAASAEARLAGGNSPPFRREISSLSDSLRSATAWIPTHGPATRKPSDRIADALDVTRMPPGWELMAGIAATNPGPAVDRQLQQFNSVNAAAEAAYTRMGEITGRPSMDLRQREAGLTKAVRLITEATEVVISCAEAAWVAVSGSRSQGPGDRCGRSAPASACDRFSRSPEGAAVGEAVTRVEKTAELVIKGLSKLGGLPQSARMVISRLAHDAARKTAWIPTRGGDRSIGDRIEHALDIRRMPVDGSVFATFQEQSIRTAWSRQQDRLREAAEATEATELQNEESEKTAEAPELGSRTRR